MANTVSLTDYTTQASDIERRRKMADMLQQESMKPLATNEMAGGYVLPISWTQGLAKALQGYAGMQGQKKATEESQALSQSRNQALAQALGGMPTGTPGTAGVPEQTYTPSATDDADRMAAGNAPVATNDTGMATEPAQIGLASKPASMQQNSSWLAQLGGIDPSALETGKFMLGQQQKEKISKDTLDAHTMDRIMSLEQQAANVAMPVEERRQRAAEANALRIDLQSRDAAEKRDRDQREFERRKEMAQLIASNRQPVQPQVVQTATGPMILGRDGRASPIIGQNGAAIQAPRGRNGNGQLPTQALKLRQEELDAIGTGASINADLGALDKQIDDGKLAPSLLNNAAAFVRNNTNNSTEESRNIGSYQATLEKLRNDSLRLNKGVQTEGDAQRAWNELMGRSNDTAYVQQRLKEIQKINDRAVNLRKMNVDAIHQNYGVDPMDVSGYQNQPAAVGSQTQDFGAPPPGAVRPRK